MSRAAPDPNPLTDLQLAQLARLAEIGMEIAEAAGRQARGLAEGEQPASDPALSFSRAARAVRLTIALQARLVAERAASERAAGAARASEASRRRDRIHTKVERALEQVAEAEGAEADAVEHLSSAAWEKLTETDDEELLDLPMEELVARICADLGLSPDWAASAFMAPVAAAPVAAAPIAAAPVAPGSAPMLAPTLAGARAPTAGLNSS